METSKSVTFLFFSPTVLLLRLTGVECRQELIVYFHKDVYFPMHVPDVHALLHWLSANYLT